MELPEEIVTFGSDADPFVRIEDTLKQEGDELIVDRKILLRQPAEFIRMDIVALE
jgi:hypothetical protein